jgi:hypothetical protein
MQFCSIRGNKIRKFVPYLCPPKSWNFRPTKITCYTVLIWWLNKCRTSTQGKKLDDGKGGPRHCHKCFKSCQILTMELQSIDIVSPLLPITLQKWHILVLHIFLFWKKSLKKVHQQVVYCKEHIQKSKIKSWLVWLVYGV